mmetsp:Transcript_21831/g.68932  ORF Transcript_21831/g.68932 Transcript_21831/m.68932 type:complete len:270 (+) Transcript_21831:91-900(+)
MRLSRPASSHMEVCSEQSPVCVELAASANLGLEAAVGAPDSGGLPKDEGVRQPSLAQYFFFQAERLAGFMGNSAASARLCCHAVKSGGLALKSGISTVSPAPRRPLSNGSVGTFRSIGEREAAGLRSAASVAYSSGACRCTRTGESAGEGPGAGAGAGAGVGKPGPSPTARFRQAMVFRTSVVWSAVSKRWFELLVLHWGPPSGPETPSQTYVGPTSDASGFLRTQATRFHSQSAWVPLYTVSMPAPNADSRKALQSGCGSIQGCAGPS